MSPLARLCSRTGNVYTGTRCGCPTCTAHQRATDRRRGSSTQRGYGHRWRQLAALALAAQPWCSHCGTHHDLTVDHIDPSSKGRADLTLADVDVLCRRCNAQKGKAGYRKVSFDSATHRQAAAQKKP